VSVRPSAASGPCLRSYVKEDATRARDCRTHERLHKLKDVGVLVSFPDPNGQGQGRPRTLYQVSAEPRAATPSRRCEIARPPNRLLPSSKWPLLTCRPLTQECLTPSTNASTTPCAPMTRRSCYPRVLVIPALSQIDTLSARGARADRPGPDELGHRARALRHGERRREAHRLDLREARPAGHRRRPPASARRARILTRKRLLSVSVTPT
jgi:hypothetical protein